MDKEAHDRKLGNDNTFISIHGTDKARNSFVFIVHEVLRRQNNKGAPVWLLLVTV